MRLSVLSASMSRQLAWRRTIARAFLASLMSDFRYRQTTATLDVKGFFPRRAGRRPIDLGCHGRGGAPAQSP